MSKKLQTYKVTLVLKRTNKHHVLGDLEDIDAMNIYFHGDNENEQES